MRTYADLRQRVARVLGFAPGDSVTFAQARAHLKRIDSFWVRSQYEHAFLEVVLDYLERET